MTRSALLLAVLFLQPLSAAAAGSVPKGAQGVPLLIATLSNGCENAATVKTVTLRHRGLGDADDLTGVYAVEPGKQKMSTRVSSAASFSGRDNTAVLRLRGFRLEPCASRTLTFAVDISPDAADAGEHALEVAALSTDGPVVTARTVASDTRQSVGPSVGSVTVSYADLTQAVRYGANRTVARIRLSASIERDQLVRSIRLTNDGSARGADLRNIRIVSTRGEALTDTADALDDDSALLMFDPALRLDSGDDLLVLVKADVRASRKRTIRLIVEEPSDIALVPARGR